MHDPDDPPPQCGWRPGEYWMVFRLTLPTNLFWLVAYIIAFIFLVPYLARGQDHHHPARDVPIHEKFYSTWYMPDNPNKSCCNKQDCYPTEVKFQLGHWWARRREDGKFIPVPDTKIERHRDNPDGRNHVCMPPPGSYNAGEVFCFSLGTGG